MKMIKQVRQGNDLDITHPRSTAIAAPRDQQQWGRLARNRQRPTVNALRNANEVVCERGVVHWTQCIMKQLDVGVASLNVHTPV
ncbi:MAG: hypothetical protein ACKPKO_61625, partial [Candidatus Fonsibacter sp.]